MPPNSFTNVFTGATILGSSVSYAAYTLTASIQLAWPLDINTNENVVANIMGVTASVGPFAMTMPSAQQVSVGQGVLFANLGANTYSVKDFGGTTILTVASGEMWFIYLRNNSTDAGVWSSVQFGAGTSSANAASLAGYGLKAITTTLNQSMPVTSRAINFTPDATYRASAQVWTGGVGTVSLTAPATLGNDWFFDLRNQGTGDLTITPLAGLIDGEATLLLPPGNSVTVVTDGTDFFTFGLTPTPTLAFDYAAIPIPGTGDYTLTGTELNRISYSFTGILTGNRNTIVPTSVQQYWVSNNTTGAFTLTVKTAAGTGIVVPAGLSKLLYCDGTNVVDAVTAYVAPDTPTSTGTDAIAITTAPFGNAYYVGLRVQFVAGGTNTTGATLDANGKGPKALQKRGAALVAGDITAGNVVVAYYDGTQFQMTSPTVALNRAQTWSAAQTFSAGIVFNGGGTNLNYYGVGTFTAILISSGGGVPTYTRQIGNYTRTGDRVSFDLVIIQSGAGTLAAGTLTVGTLPFTAAADLTSNGGLGFGGIENLTLAAGDRFVTAIVAQSSTSISLAFTQSGGAAQSVVVGDIAANALLLQIGGQYRV